MPWVAQKSAPVAITENDYLEYGCPVCGTEQDTHWYVPMGDHGTSVIACSHCKIAFFVCGNEDERSSIWPGTGGGSVCAQLGGDGGKRGLLVQPHPFRKLGFLETLRGVVKGLLEQFVAMFEV